MSSFETVSPHWPSMMRRSVWSRPEMITSVREVSVHLHLLIGLVVRFLNSRNLIDGGESTQCWCRFRSRNIQDLKFVNIAELSIFTTFSSRLTFLSDQIPVQAVIYGNNITCGHFLFSQRPIMFLQTWQEFTVMPATAIKQIRCYTFEKCVYLI